MSVDQIMANMGFGTTDLGPFATKLKEHITAQVNRGLKNRSYGTWAGNPSNEERAKAILAMDWELEQGNSVHVNSVDGPPWGYRYNFSQGYPPRKTFKIHWNHVKPWLEDQINLRLFDLRMFWQRKVLRKKNPYT